MMGRVIKNDFIRKPRKQILAEKYPNLPGAMKEKLSEASTFSPNQLAEFIKSQAEDMAKNQLRGNLVKMFQSEKPAIANHVGNDLYIRDQIIKWSEKSEKQIYDIMLQKIRDYERIYPEYDYVEGENVFDQFDGIQLIFKFTKRDVNPHSDN